MTAFYDTDFVRPYRDHLDSAGSWREALCLLALGGLSTGHNRLPVTWSRRDEKVRRITGWTVDAEHPRGSRREAEAILDLWTCDCRSVARRLRATVPGLLPELYERPILKLGRHLFQLPWLTAFQNNQTAVINNLRRLGARRAEARDETRRIEERLAGLLRGRGFAVRLNHTPPPTDGDDPGEVDLVCAREGAVLVLEVKSTFVRKSARETWLHGSRALGRAGRQLRRKVTALAQDTALADALGIDLVGGPTKVCAWIVDTSIEHDHERFGGFLKVSLEELIIALRDDRHLLNEADRILAPDAAGAGKGDRDDEAQRTTLYPTGFSFAALVDVIESESVWAPHPVAPRAFRGGRRDHHSSVVQPFEYAGTPPCGHVRRRIVPISPSAFPDVGIFACAVRPTTGRFISPPRRQHPRPACSERRNAGALRQRADQQPRAWC